MEQSDKERELMEIEEQIDTHNKLLIGYNDDLRAEYQRQLAILRSIIRTENKIEQLEMRKKALSDEIRGDMCGGKSNYQQRI